MRLPTQCAGLAAGERLFDDTSVGGSPINVVDGYATLEQLKEAGALDTNYTTSLTLVFTDYANASGLGAVTDQGRGPRADLQRHVFGVDDCPARVCGRHLRRHESAGQNFFIRGEIAGQDLACRPQSKNMCCGAGFQGPLKIDFISDTRITGSIGGGSTGATASQRAV